MLVLGLMMCVTLYHTEASTPEDSIAQLTPQIPDGSAAIPIGNFPPLSPSGTSGESCCQALPGICNAHGDCIYDLETCTKICMCVGGLPSFMCEQIFKDIKKEITSSTLLSPLNQNAPEEGTLNADKTTSITNLLPSLSPSSLETVTIQATGFTMSATPVLDSVSASVSVTPQDLPLHNGTNRTGVDKKTITSTYRLQTASTVFNKTLTSSQDDMHKEPDASVNSGNLHNQDFSISASTTFAADHTKAVNDSAETNQIEDISTLDEFSDFIPPVMESASTCANCSGTCIFSWNRSPMFECDENSICSNFKCSEHGDCVINDDGSIGCDCYPNYTGVFCDDLCDLDCGEMGWCSIVNETMHCVCNWNYTGEGCLDMRTTPSPIVKEYMIASDFEPWTVIGVCLGLLVLLLLLVIVLPYWTWRRRWLPMRRLVHYFQQYEDDDGKEFDAFISYKSTKRDEDFVVHKLYPKLEKELDFKLCMHFRDFPPGAAIADNIINAIESSRRTIMILSPAYVESEWCRLEYQKAQHEMLKRKHRIIPILLEDISEVKDMDTNLKQIINTVTYINWPGDENTKKLNKFWQLMVCALPKKKQDSGQSETSASGSSSSDLPLTSVTGSHFPDTLSDDVFPDKRESSTSVDDEFGIDITDRNNRPSEKCASDTVLNVSSDDMKDITTNCVDKPKSDDHVIEIRKLPGNRMKILRRFKLDLNFGRKATS